MSRKFILWIAAILLVGGSLLGLGYCGIRKVQNLESIERTIAEEFRNIEHILPSKLALMLELEPENVIVIDCRNPEEYAISRIPGALNLQEVDAVTAALEEREIPPETIAVYCSVGYRSSKLATALQKAGIENAVNLRGSIFAWANEDRPLETPKGEPVDVVHPYNQFFGRLMNEGKAANLKAPSSQEDP